MLDFWKKRRETAQAAEQQRKIEALLSAQGEFLALYGQPTRPATAPSKFTMATFVRGFCTKGDSVNLLGAAWRYIHKCLLVVVSQARFKV